MKIICWWSGGITSAVACKLAIDLYGTDNCEVIMIDTRNEDEDTYRFKADCEKWYGLPIKTIDNFGNEYETIQDVWYKHNSLNVAHGAVCSSELKRKTREIWQRTNEYTHQVFGFEFDKKEFNRAKGLMLNHSKSRPIFPLLMFGMDKEDCIKYIEENKIEPPRAYKWGFKNNNCMNTGCPQGGIAYWKKMQSDMPDKFNAMAKIEHDLTDRKGKPVTMLKDQSKAAKESGNILVFLKPHPTYPNLKCIDEMKGGKLEPVMDCNGFCGVNDLNPKNETEDELSLLL